MAISALARKLKIKQGKGILVVNPPSGYLDQLKPLPEGVELVMEPEGHFDLVQLFVQDSAASGGLLPSILQSLKEDSIFWVSFPKRSSKIQTDLSRNRGWDALHKAGYKGVALISIDDTWSAMRFRARQMTTEQDLVAAQYAGKKSSLYPIYEHLVEAAQSFGPDVETAPRKTYVGLVRKKVFAVIKASTSTRVDLALKFKDIESSDRLIEMPGFGSGAITHKVALASLEQVDEQVIGWPRQAYDGVR